MPDVHTPGGYVYPPGVWGPIMPDRGTATPRTPNCDDCAASRGRSAAATADRGRHLLHRCPDAGLGRHARPAVLRARPARRAPQPLRHRSDRDRRSRRAGQGRRGVRGDRTAGALMTRTAQLDVTGMTCASCVARVEKRLNAIDGVQATVNLATQTATVVTATPVPDAQLVAAVEAAGYSATVRGTSATPARPRRLAGSDLTRRLLVERAAGRAGPPDRDDAPVGQGIRGLDRTGTGHSGGAVGRLAVPSGGGGQRPAPGDHDGHARQHRRGRGLDVVGDRGRRQRPVSRCTSRLPPSSSRSCCWAGCWRRGRSGRPDPPCSPYWTWAPSRRSSGAARSSRRSRSARSSSATSSWCGRGRRSRPTAW